MGKAKDFQVNIMNSKLLEYQKTLNILTKEVPV